MDEELSDLPDCEVCGESLDDCFCEDPNASL